jgi:hypothetical protein
MGCHRNDGYVAARALLFRANMRGGFNPIHLELRDSPCFLSAFKNIDPALAVPPRDYEGIQ